MKIVVVTPAAPHPFGDTAAKWLYVMIRGLLAEGHHVSCITVSAEKPELLRDAQERLLPLAVRSRFRFLPLRMSSEVSTWRRKMRSLRQPFSEILYSDGFAKALDAELREGYDILHLEQLWTGWAGLGRPRSLLNVHHFEIIDWEGRRLHGLDERKTLWQMHRATRDILRRTPQMRCFTERLLQKARSINPSARYWVVPFAIDVASYPLQTVSDQPVIGLIGSMHWEPSRSAGERLITRIWPLIRRRLPHATLLIGGWNAGKFLGRYLPQAGVTLQENLAHPVQFFSQAAVMVYAPSRGSGFKVKVMESMAYGVPVVTTWEGVEGMEYENGTHCWVEETDEAMAEKACELLDNVQHRERMRHAARALMEDRYSPAPVVSRMLRVYEEMAARA